MNFILIVLCISCIVRTGIQLDDIPKGLVSLKEGITNIIFNLCIIAFTLWMLGIIP